MFFPGSRFAFLVFVACLAAFDAPAEEASVQAERLRQLLARVEREPVAALAVLDAQSFLDLAGKTSAGRAFNDPQYAPQRREAMRLLEAGLGAHPEVVWDALRPHLAGPLALVLTAAEGGAPADEPALRLALLAAVKDAGAAEAVRLGWPQVPPDSDAFLGVVALRLHPVEELAAPRPVPAWADRCAKMSGEMQVLLRPEAVLTALKPLAMESPRTPEWMRLLKALCPPGIEQLELNLLPTGRFFTEELRCELKPGAPGWLPHLLRSLRADPQPWDALAKALPGGQDIQVLLQADLKALGPDLPATLQYFERLLRGSRWARLHGNTAEALAPDRFAFLTQPWAGTFGLVARNGESGETEITGVAAEPDSKAAARRARLSEGLEGLGLDFQASAQAPTIGNQAPLAAGFKGRGVMPAPMIGFSDGWVWLCSSTAAYHELVSALIEGRDLAKERRAAASKAPAAEPKMPFPEQYAFGLRVNLPNVGPLAYTSWMLGESGTYLFGWKVPSGLLPSPGFLKKHLVPYEVVCVRTEREVRFYARGPAPGGALLPLAGLAGVGEEMRRAAESGPEGLRKELDHLIHPAGGPKGEGK